MHFVPSRDGLNVPSFDAEYFFLPPLLSSIPCFSLLFRGRRQLPQAGEVRRPRGRGVVSLWVEIGSSALGSLRVVINDTEGQGAEKHTNAQPPAPGAGRSRGMAKMGGPGAGGLWRGFVVCVRCRLAAFAK